MRWLSSGLSLFFGTALPGAVMHTYFPAFSSQASANVWAIMGFVCGIVGLAVPPTCYAARDAFLKTPIGRWVAKWLNTHTPDKDDSK